MAFAPNAPYLSQTNHIDAARQIIIVDLLRQVCAFYDSTPHAFINQVLEYVRSGILDHEWQTLLQKQSMQSFDPKQLAQSLSAVRSIERPSPYVGYMRHSPPACPPPLSLLSRASSCPSPSEMSMERVHELVPMNSIACEYRELIGLNPLSDLSIFQRDFIFIRKLGQGAFGVVVEAQNKLDGKRYAVKCVLFNAFEEDIRKKTLREVQTWSHARHPHVCRYFHSWVESGWQTHFALVDVKFKKPDIQMVCDRARENLPTPSSSKLISNRFLSGSTEQYLSGRSPEDDSDENLSSVALEASLPKRIRRTEERKFQYPETTLFIQMELCVGNMEEWCKERRTDMDKQQLFEHMTGCHTIFDQLLSALEHIHKIGLIHRDIKPSNIFHLDDDSWVLGDFGLSTFSKEEKIIIYEEQEHHDLPSESGIIGTATYSAPEQLTGGVYDASADIFSLALVFVEIVMLFSTMHERGLVFLALRDNRDIRSMPRFEECPAFWSLIFAMTSPNPSERPTAASLLENKSVWQGELTKELMRLKSENECVDEMMPLDTCDSLGSTLTSSEKCESMPEKMERGVQTEQE